MRLPRIRRAAAHAIFISFAVAAAALAAWSAGDRDATDRPAFWQVLERAMEKGAVQVQAAQVLAHMGAVPEQHAGVANRLARVDRMLREPWTPPAVAAELRDLLASPSARGGKERFAGLYEGIALWLDLEPTEDAALAELDAAWAEIESPALEGLALLEALSEYVGLAHRALDEGLAGLEEDDWPLLFQHHADFCEGWYRSHFPGASLPEEQAKLLERFRDALLARPKNDRGRLLGVAAAIARLAEPAFVNGLARRLADARAPEVQDGYDRDVLAVIGGEQSHRVVLAGRGNAVHSEPAALVIDLGGKDRYARAAVVDGASALVSVVIDLAGDDAYESAALGPCYAAGGVALLVDMKGDDRYRSGRLGQAAAVLGAALQVDVAGDDVYEMEDYGQGHALCGVALLYDLAGDDRYGAWACAQGGGIGYGLSALVDGEGDDAYVADGHWPDVYGDSGPDVYHGASQGYCTGLRPQVAGGFAALLDLGTGRDRYQAGSFAQGGGYYFSFGLMYDGGGDDENHGSRYAQGFGVHQAAGLRWDAAGNDTYTCRSVAHAGMAWDEGVGYLLDDEGDDTYQVGGLACGGAAQTGVAVCIDLDGEDRYLTGTESQGGTGGSEYHQKPSLGFLLDLGGDRDERSLTDRGDEALLTTEGVGVFLDSAARDAEQALRSRLLRTQ